MSLVIYFVLLELTLEQKLLYWEDSKEKVPMVSRSNKTNNVCWDWASSQMKGSTQRSDCTNVECHVYEATHTLQTITAEHKSLWKEGSPNHSFWPAAFAGCSVASWMFWHKWWTLNNNYIATQTLSHMGLSKTWPEPHWCHQKKQNVVSNRLDPPISNRKYIFKMSRPCPLTSYFTGGVPL